MAARQFDVAICGAGPAGSTCALALAKSGLSVALFEKNSFPRDKICGDAIAPYVPNVLGTIDPQLQKDIEAFDDKYSVNVLRVVAPNQKVLDLKFQDGGSICSRLSLDNFLFERAAALANVTVFQHTSIKDISIAENQSIITTKTGEEFRAKIVIGCDGAQGIIAKKLTDTKVDLKHYSGAVRAYYKGITDIPEGTFELHYLKDLMPGYFWIFPLPDGYANVGLGMLSQNISDQKLNLRQLMPQIIAQTPSLQKRFANATLQTKIQGFGLPLGSRKVPISGAHFMLCGDAAALIDPLSGEGIGQALISGRYAAWQAIKCFEKNDFSAAAMKEYDKTVYAKLWRMHQMHYYTQIAINNRPWVLNSIVGLANKSHLFYNLVQKLI